MTPWTEGYIPSAMKSYGHGQVGDPFIRDEKTDRVLCYITLMRLDDDQYCNKCEHHCPSRESCIGIARLFIEGRRKSIYEDQRRIRAELFRWRMRDLAMVFAIIGRLDRNRTDFMPNTANRDDVVWFMHYKLNAGMVWVQAFHRAWENWKIR